MIDLFIRDFPSALSVDYRATPAFSAPSFKWVDFVVALYWAALLTS
jgi:hypothetical protein